MEVSGQLHAPAALPPGKEPLVPIGWEAGWAPESVRTRYRREKFPVLPVRPDFFFVFHFQMSLFNLYIESLDTYRLCFCFTRPEVV
jgi:hypothetical protein